MRFSERWLREWVDPPVSTGQLVSQLTLAGLEVDAVTPVAGAFSGVVVAEVLSVAPHPDADRLSVCQVGSGAETLQIVCGAANVRAGLKAPLATVGGELPGGLKVKRARLRGVESSGMLCSARELGIEEASAGLLELPADAPVGTDLRDYLQLDDSAIEVDLTPNRGDCLGLAGIAREVGVLNRCPVQAPAMDPVAPAIDDRFDVDILAPAACPRYVGRVVRGIDPAAPTPLWMAERLRRSGLRAISAVVDVTNYVLLELGQPMHAFDLSRLDRGIRVRFAEAGETLTLLDGQAVDLGPETLVIADHRGPVALAGIMGGQDAAVGADTRDIFLESAFFTPADMAGRARRYKLHTDSSHRFERGVDPALQALAVERATALILAVCGGRPGPVLERSDPASLPRPAPIRLRSDRIRRVLGQAVPPEEVADVLSRLGLRLSPVADGWDALAPGFRFDITREEDLIEEIARVRGYDRIPSSRPGMAVPMRRDHEGRVSMARLRSLLADRGYQEAITYSFVEPRLQALLDPQVQPVALANPISADMAVMRTQLWPGLLKALIANRNRQHSRVRLFEIGRVYRPGDDGRLIQPMRIGAVASGPVWPEQWGAGLREGDFFDLKGDLEALISLSRNNLQHIEYKYINHPALHPGQGAALTLDGQPLGLMGALHPELSRILELPASVYLLEIDAALAAAGDVPRFQPLSRFPALRRDLAVVVDNAVSAAAVLACARRDRPPILRDLQLFDVYTGEGIDSGKKSLALALTFQGLSSTLIDSEVDAVVEIIINRLETELGATPRG